MLVHPWDAAADEEWRSWLAGRDFGQLVAGGRTRDLPVVVPTHFVFDGERAWLHLARPNPIWPALEEHPRAVLSVIDDYVYVPSAWQAPPGTPVERGVPTSFYATVQLACDVRIVDDPHEKAEILNRQLGHFEPGSARCPVSPEPGADGQDNPDRRSLRGIRGLVLTVTDVTAKFKYAGNKEPAHREQMAERLAHRDGRSDADARAHVLRQLTSAAEPRVSQP